MGPSWLQVGGTGAILAPSLLVDHAGSKLGGFGAIWAPSCEGLGAYVRPSLEVLGLSRLKVERPIGHLGSKLEVLLPSWLQDRRVLEPS